MYGNLPKSALRKLQGVAADGPEMYIVASSTNSSKKQDLMKCINLYHSLGIFSRRQIDDIFLIFPRKQDLTFHANCLLRRQFA